MRLSFPQSARWPSEHGNADVTLGRLLAPVAHQRARDVRLYVNNRKLDRGTSCDNCRAPTWAHLLSLRVERSNLVRDYPQVKLCSLPASNSGQTFWRSVATMDAFPATLHEHSVEPVTVRG